MSEDNGDGSDAPECLKDFLDKNDEHNAAKESAKGDSKPAETELAKTGDGNGKTDETNKDRKSVV